MLAESTKFIYFIIFRKLMVWICCYSWKPNDHSLQISEYRACILKFASVRPIQIVSYFLTFSTFRTLLVVVVKIISINFFVYYSLLYYKKCGALASSNKNITTNFKKHNLLHPKFQDFRFSRFGWASMKLFYHREI